jgi:hypothetical protein
MTCKASTGTAGGGPTASPSWPTRCSPWSWTAGCARPAATISVGAHPGYSHTGLLYGGPNLGGGGIFARVMGLAASFTGQPAAQGALPVLRAATDPRARGGDYYGPRGPGEGMGAPRKVRYARTARDEQLAYRLWKASEVLPGVTFPGLTGHPPAHP